MIYKVEPSDIYEFEFGGNLKQPEGQRGAVEIRHPSTLEISEAMRGKKLTDGNYEFLFYVHKIFNYKIDTGEEVVDATPALLLSTPGLGPLVAELKKRYKKYIAIDKKKLESD